MAARAMPLVPELDVPVIELGLGWAVRGTATMAAQSVKGDGRRSVAEALRTAVAQTV